MNERKETPMNLIGQLPLAPPDPLGSALWHSQNEGDILLKGDQLLSEFFLQRILLQPEKFLKFALPPLGSMKEEEKGESPEEGEETQEEEEEKEGKEVQDISIGSGKNTPKLEI